MFEFLQPYDGPVIPGESSHREVVYAKEQPQYIPLRTVLSNGPEKRATSRWALTPAQRKAIAEGADLFLQLSTFGTPLQPIRMFVTDETKAECPADRPWVAEHVLND